MRKIMSIVFVLCLTGCACGRNKKEAILRQALDHTNQALTECRGQNEAYHRVLMRDRKIINAYHRNSRTNK